ncbi:MAG: winged helix-turn-helix domain-containing protein [Myxococcota bacterium]
MLAWLAEHPDEVFTLHQLHERVWGYSPTVNSRAAYSCIHRVRSLVEADPRHPTYLRSERGEGYRLVGAVLYGDDAPLRLTNAPASADAFVGRAEELGALARIHREQRPSVLTLLGPGGVGKTRLAQEAALASTVPGGAWVADLIRADELPDVCARIAAAVPGSPNPDPDALLRALLRLGPCWLILDNAEDALAVAADLVSRWAAAAPDCRLFATSRQRLGVAGEQVLEIGPLSAAPATALLVDRIRRRSPSTADAADRPARRDRRVAARAGDRRCERGAARRRRGARVAPGGGRAPGARSR